MDLDTGTGDRQQMSGAGGGKEPHGDALGYGRANLVTSTHEQYQALWRRTRSSTNVLERWIGECDDRARDKTEGKELHRSGWGQTGQHR